MFCEIGLFFVLSNPVKSPKSLFFYKTSLSESLLFVRPKEGLCRCRSFCFRRNRRDQGSVGLQDMLKLAEILKAARGPRMAVSPKTGLNQSLSTPYYLDVLLFFAKTPTVIIIVPSSLSWFVLFDQNTYKHELDQ